MDESFLFPLAFFPHVFSHPFPSLVHTPLSLFFPLSSLQSTSFPLPSCFPRFRFPFSHLQSPLLPSCAVSPFLHTRFPSSRRLCLPLCRPSSTLVSCSFLTVNLPSFWLCSIHPTFSSWLHDLFHLLNIHHSFSFCPPSASCLVFPIFFSSFISSFLTSSSCFFSYSSSFSSFASDSSTSSSSSS